MGGGAGGGGLPEPAAGAGGGGGGGRGGEKREARRAARRRLERALAGAEGERVGAAEAGAGAAALLGSGLWTRARAVGMYADSPRLREFPTSALLAEALAAGKRVYYPRVEGERMRLLQVFGEGCLRETPPYGLREPPLGRGADGSGSPREDCLSDASGGLDLLLVPGMAFDRSGRRLGRGGGFYDRFIEECVAGARSAGRDRPLLVGLCYSAQVSAEPVVTDPHDAKVDVVLAGRECWAREDLPGQHLDGLPLGGGAGGQRDEGYRAE